MSHSKSGLKVLSVVLLSLVLVVGTSGEVRSQIVVQQSTNQSQSIDRLIEQLKSGDDRRNAVKALVKIGAPAIPHLIPLLQDQDSKVRSNAVYALGEMGESAKSAIPHLIPLLKDQDEYLRSIAAEALEKLGYKP